MNWKEIIKEESSKDYFKNLVSFLQEDGKQYTIFPEHKNVFNALTYCSLDKVKVLILGQDPYHGEKQAHGLAFSVLPECPIPPSLKNIFKEIQSDLNLTTNNFSHGCLSSWAEQGVMLLNTSLTVRQGEPGSHQNIGWHHFTDRVIKEINKLNNPIVYLLWGSFARKKKELIINQNHFVLESFHPSPLSAYQGFFGCKHFSQTNNFLIKNNITPIDWSIK